MPLVTVVLDRIQETVQAEPTISRRELSRQVCRLLDWRSPNGRLQEMSCRKALVKLNRQGILALPIKETTYGFERSTTMALNIFHAFIRSLIFHVPLMSELKSYLFIQKQVLIIIILLEGVDSWSKSSEALLS